MDLLAGPARKDGFAFDQKVACDYYQPPVVGYYPPAVSYYAPSHVPYVPHGYRGGAVTGR